MLSCFALKYAMAATRRKHSLVVLGTEISISVMTVQHCLEVWFNQDIENEPCPIGLFDCSLFPLNTKDYSISELYLQILLEKYVFAYRSLEIHISSCIHNSIYIHIYNIIAYVMRVFNRRNNLISYSLSTFLALNIRKQTLKPFFSCHLSLWQFRDEGLWVPIETSSTLMHKGPKSISRALMPVMRLFSTLLQR